MAACLTNVVVGSVGDALALTPHSNGRPQRSPPTLCRCSCTRQASQSGPRGNIYVFRKSGGPRRGRSWGPHGMMSLQHPRTKSRRSLSFCSPTDVSSDASAAASAELNVVEEGSESESGMSIEEQNAILAFEAAEIDAEKERNSSEDLQLSSSGVDEEGYSEDLKAMKDREVTELKRQASKAVQGQGAAIANVVTLFITLLDRPSPGEGKMIAGAGSAVIERVEEEVAKFQGVEGVDGQSLFEILRLVKLLQMDIQLIAAARKDSTLSERLVQAKTHCRQVLNILSML